MENKTRPKESIGKSLVRKGKPPIKKLSELRIPLDSWQDWQSMGFKVIHPSQSNSPANPVFPYIQLDNIIIYLVGGSSRKCGWAFDTYPAHHGDMYFEFEGIPTCLISERDGERAGLIGYSRVGQDERKHPNCVSMLKRVVISVRKDDFKKMFGGLMAMMEMDIITPRGSKNGPIVHKGETLYAYFRNPESGIVIELVSVGNEVPPLKIGIQGLIFEASEPLESVSYFAANDKAKIKQTMQDPERKIIEIGSSNHCLRLAVVYKPASTSSRSSLSKF